MSLLKFNLAKFEEALAFQVINFDYDGLTDLDFISNETTNVLVSKNKSKIDYNNNKTTISIPKRSVNTQNTDIVYFKSNDERDIAYDNIIDALKRFVETYKSADL